ncbi:MAG: homogentisate 1,2-dioxygenase [Deltaproteobacteria bacterium]|nr:homogentisate 1,2-dioxygenase [Deltaproteobacteria bacterium]
MPIYHRQGELPHKRHIVFKKDGALLYEQLMGNKGFSGLSSLFYHLRRPTTLKSTKLLQRVAWEADPDETLRMRHFRLGHLEAGGSATLHRHPVLFNGDVAISLAMPTVTDDFFYRNGQGDELLYVAEGQGTLQSICGELPYGSGDYLVIPRGITYRLAQDAGKPHRLLVIESASAIRTPQRYRNEFGQLLEHSPFCERDIRRPEALPMHDEEGEFRVVVKAHNHLTEVVLDHHPFDVVGWDGYYYPWAFNIENFEPITGRVHQPPPVHQTFEGDNFVVCSFVPRLYDYHPQAIPAPYNHANVMTDEVLFYAKDRFMSRRGIELSSLTLHPDGLTHGPHPGTAEASIGKKETDELAVMIDTFRPLKVSQHALQVEDLEYGASWLDPT